MENSLSLGQTSGRRLRLVRRFVFTFLFMGLAMMASGGAAAFAMNRGQVTTQQSPVAVVAASYQAMNTAMTAGMHAKVAHSVSTANVLTSSQAQVSNSANGTFLYSYDLYRIQSFVNWSALHSKDYSSIAIGSTFQATSVSVTGNSALVKGIEAQHIDTTIQDNGQAHLFSPAKQAAQAWIKQAGLFLAFGQTNHATALIDHTVTLSMSSHGWVIEADQYWDPLARALAPDHHSLQKTQTPVTGSSQPQVVHPAISFTYFRQSAINYAEAWVNSCNSKYNCYMSGGVDCANYVSAAIYDESGGNLPGDNSWYSINHADTYAFVNVSGLYNHTLGNFAGSSYSSYSYSTAAFDDDWFEYPGDLVFYDWGNVFGFGAANGVLDHVAISVVQDANGYTYEDAHTTNLKHYYWDLGGGTQTGYYFVILRNNG